MATSPNPDTVSSILAALPTEGGIQPRDVLAALNGYSSQSVVQTVLLQLVRAGQAVRCGAPGSYLYRRAQEGS